MSGVTFDLLHSLGQLYGADADHFAAVSDLDAVGDHLRARCRHAVRPHGHVVRRSLRHQRQVLKGPRCVEADIHNAVYVLACVGVAAVCAGGHLVELHLLVGPDLGVDTRVICQRDVTVRSRHTGVGSHCRGVTSHRSHVTEGSHHTGVMSHRSQVTQ